MSEVIERIKKLLRIGQPGSGATEEEASTAMGLAAALMLKHGLEVQLDDDREPETVLGREFRGYSEAWHLNVASAAGYLYSCRHVVWRRVGQYQFVGREDNVEACAITMQWLCSEVERLYKLHLPRGMSKADRTEYRRTFKWACSMRLAARAWAIMEMLRQDDAKALEATGSRALVVVESIDQQLKAAADKLEEMGVTKRIVVHPRAAGLGTQAGRDAGDTVELQKRVS